MNQALIQPLTLGSQQLSSSEQQCIDGIGSYAHHTSYAGGGVPDPLLVRRDQSAASLLSLPQGNAASYMAPRSAAHDRHFHADTSPGSISTSPRSNASSIAYSSLPGPAFYTQQQQIGGVAQPYSTTSPVFANTANYSQQSFGHPSFRRGSLIADGSQSVMLPPARSPGLGNPVSLSLGTTARDNYTTSTPGLHRHGALSPRSHADSLANRTPYSSVPDTPRSVLSGASLSLSPGAIPPYTNAATMLTYPTQHDARQQADSPPFADQETFHEISSDGQIVVPQITCRVEKGFFYSLDRTWTCYRRNYFSVVASYSLSPHLPNARLYLDRGSRNGPEQIQAMAVTLSAAVDGASGKSIELVQHTPKRDKGPQTSIKMEKLAPTPPNKTQTDPHGYPINTFHTSAAMASPYLPLQADPEQQYSPAGHSSTSHQHTFERIQFKSATANNGKRRAQQQYYHLIVELYADVRRPGEPEPDWVRVAQRVSAAVVVRGRSPSHYQHEGPHSASSSRGGPGTGSGAGGPGHQAFGAPGAPGAAGRGLPNSLAMLGGAGMGGAVYRGSQYPLDPSPVGSHSVSSASSISGGPVEGLVGEQALLDEDSKAMDHFDGYQYYPSPLAEAGLPVGPKSEYDPSKRVKAEYGETVPSSWSMGSCGRFQGVETSRGYYPDLNAGAGY